MGTRGYYVYRYRNKYFAYYINWDCYPSGLGVDMIRTMRLPNAIIEKRKELESLLDERKGIPDSEGSVDNLTISSRRPQNNILIEWIYEIDLDRNIFHINGIPFFNLECLPDEEAFLEYVPDSCNGGHPNYRNLARKMQCPPKHKYKMPGPPVVDDSDLTTYQSSVCTGSHVALSDLLAISDVLSPDEQVRVSLLETMIGQCMIVYSGFSQIGYDPPWIGHVLYDFELLSNHNQITDEEWLGACSMANFAFVPQLFDSSKIIHCSLSRKEFTWVREDTVVYIATHLDDERCLQAAISRLITAILEQKHVPGDYFGVAFSIYHCAIVKVVKDRDTTTFSHTAAIQFLPSFSSDSRSTPGITALARLGHRMDPTLFVRAMRFAAGPGQRWTRRTRSPRKAMMYYPMPTVQHFLSSFGKRSLFISISQTSSPSGWCQNCVVKQPRWYSIILTSAVIALSVCLRRYQRVYYKITAFCMLHLFLLHEPAFLLL